MKIFFFVLVLICISVMSFGSIITQKQDSTKIELIVVFKKEIALEKAISILDKTKVVYRKGMDSSKGKSYFYSTGPKFTITFKNEKEKELFLKENKEKEEIYEIYKPNRNIVKD